MLNITIDICDLCKGKETDRRFKVKMARKGYYEKTGYGGRWVNLWQPYERIAICEDCGEKLFGIKSSRTIVNDIIKQMKR